MFLLITYDVPSDRTHIYRKLLRKHLQHIQQSVFCGDVTEGQLKSIRLKIEDLVEQNDSIYIFTAEPFSTVQCDVLGDGEDPVNQFTF